MRQATEVLGPEATITQEAMVDGVRWVDFRRGGRVGLLASRGYGAGERHEAATWPADAQGRDRAAHMLASLLATTKAS